MTLTEKINRFLTKNEKKIAVLSMILASITSILLFDVKVSLSGDDCDYIIAADGFWKNFTYPGHHGPLYPIVLSPFVGIFGVKLVLLKFLSAIFIVSSIWFFYKSFQRIIPVIILLPVLILVSFNPYVLFFAGYTYSEPLYMLMQALFFYFFSKYFWRNETVYTLKKDWKKYLVIVLTIIGMGLTRTIGFCTAGILMLYFLLERRRKDLFYTVGIFTLLFGILYVSKPVIWPNSPTVQSFETLLAKNPYNPEQGAEDVFGLITRVYENSNIYISGYLYKYFGFRSSSDVPLEDIPPLSIITYILFFICLVSVFKKDKVLLFTGLYAGTMLFANFVLLHKLWAQDRILMVYYPFILLFLLGGCYYLFTGFRFKQFSSVYLLLLAALFIGSGIHAKNRIGRNIPVLQQNILGNDLYGLTPDWENFIKMSRWAGQNLDREAVIASRKPSISYVYTGRNFHGIFNVPYVNIHEIVENTRAEKNEYVFLTVELGQNDHLLANLKPFMQYFFITKAGATYTINGRNVQNAISYKINRVLFNEEITDFLDANQFNYTLDYDSYLKQYAEDRNIGYQIINPDELLNYLKDSNIRYLILAQIRIYTSQNTGRYVNTIHQYVTFTNMKYPNLFRMIHTIGKEEICELAEFIGQ